MCKLFITPVSIELVLCQYMYHGGIRIDPEITGQFIARFPPVFYCVVLFVFSKGCARNLFTVSTSNGLYEHQIGARSPPERTPG